MAAEHETVMFDVHDAKVYALTDDTGASPTYGAAVDVFGIAQVGLDPTFVTAELKGDGGKVLAKKGKIDRLGVQATYGRLSQDVLGIIMGANLTDVSASQAKARLIAGESLPYFKFACTIDDADNGIGSVHLTLFKCQMTGGSLLSGQTDNFSQPTLQAEAIGLEVDGTAGDFPTDLMADIDFFTTVTALPS